MRKGEIVVHLTALYLPGESVNPWQYNFSCSKLFDLDGGYACTLTKKKLVMRAGETGKATTMDHKELEEMGKKIGTGLGHIANLDCDVFVTDKGCYLIDMNPRFGGGYPFSHMAGANIPAAIMAWADGTRPDPSWLKVTPGVTAVKCDRLVEIR